MEDGWTFHDLYWDLHSPVSQEAEHLTLKRVEYTNTSYTEAQLHCITPVFLISLSPLCIELL